MKAIIKVVTAGKFSEDQKQILRRVLMVLIERGFSEINIKKSKPLKLNKAI